MKLHVKQKWIWFSGAVHNGCPVRVGEGGLKIKDTGGQGKDGLKQLVDVRFEICGAHT